ncbi:carboxypeptidase-like regulatory domain-containing protein [Terriglobus saanensis]|uniref:carboxypeptidase-like regulatory domain-containing protein n=1 Tax=Terriglobus saanensis TaxID=870903 RepID=UPI0002FE8EE5|nr:carboxypeptidase-like regulatory domain-containing protein [Terriglobus saanensis]
MPQISAQQIVNAVLIDAPAPQSTALPSPTPSQLIGTVTSAEGGDIAGAQIILTGPALPSYSAVTDSDGFFKLPAIAPGTYTITITATGFSPWTHAGVVVQPGKDVDLPSIQLKIATVYTSVDALSQHEVAVEQLKVEEHQRVLGVIPNFFVTFEKNPAPLSTGQKYHLAWRTAIDPVTFGFTAIAAGVEQANNTFSGFGTGPAGYGKRFGAATGDTFSATFFGGAVYPSLFHQDPRYFYKGTGTIKKRAMYAIASAVLCKSDSGKWQPNYSFIAGNFTAAGLSNAYYPASNRGAGLTLTNAALATASASIGALFEEFLLARITTKHKP